MMTNSQTYSSTLGRGGIPSLDGIRAVAVALVLFAHSGLQNIVPGGLGVTLFFVLSGYLITTLMRIELQRTGSLSYRNFYLRRLLRLMPPLTIVVAIAALLATASLVDGNFTSTGLLAALFYFGNYFVIHHNFQGMPQGIGVVWSLAVEEHFYIFYPPLAVLLLKLNRARLSTAILTTLCIVILAWRCWLATQGTSADYIGMATDTRIDAILIGCALAIARNPWLDHNAVYKPRRAASIGALCCAVLLGTLLYRNEFFRLTARYTLQSAAIAPLLYLSIVYAREPMFRWLNNKYLVYIGSISYTIYLSHHLILSLVEKQWPLLGLGLTLIISAALTLAFAEPVRRWVEVPCAQLRKRLHRETPARAIDERSDSVDVPTPLARAQS